MEGEPKELWRMLTDSGRSRAVQPAGRILLRSIQAGIYVALAGAFSVAVGSTGLPSIVSGLSFVLGLALVLLGEAELFTGSNMTVGMAYLNREVGGLQMIRQWGLCFAGNLVGSLIVVGLCLSAKMPAPWAAKAVDVAAAKTALPFGVALARGIGCNVLVCLAVLMAAPASTIGSKILAIIWPITAFVTLGFEHSVANMFYLPLGAFLGSPVSLVSIIYNLIPVTLGNIIGGWLLVGWPYWRLGYSAGVRTNRKTPGQPDQQATLSLK